MPEGAPELIAINHDEYSAKHIGKTEDGRQFFLTTPFVPAVGDNAGREFIALYLFDDEGSLLEAKIDDLGIRKEVDNDAARALIETRLADLGDISFGDIEVAPFRLERFSTEFGLIATAPEEEDEEWSVIVEPGNYMAFYPPWDGDYDT
jgi:hypothetical protein